MSIDKKKIALRSFIGFVVNVHVVDEKINGRLETDFADYVIVNRDIDFLFSMSDVAQIVIDDGIDIYIEEEL